MGRDDESMEDAVKRTARIAAVAAIAALALTACGDREDDGDDNDSDASDTPSVTEETSPTDAAEQFPDFKACMVSDSGGFDDKSFNQTSHDGLEAAATKYGVQTAEAESTDPSQFADNIQSLVDEGCNQITTVGFLLGDATPRRREEEQGRRLRDRRLRLPRQGRTRRRTSRA